MSLRVITSNYINYLCYFVKLVCRGMEKGRLQALKTPDQFILYLVVLVIGI